MIANWTAVPEELVELAEFVALALFARRSALNAAEDWFGVPERKSFSSSMSLFSDVPIPVTEGFAAAHEASRAKTRAAVKQTFKGSEEILSHPEYTY